jgi:hypothetical protein
LTGLDIAAEGIAHANDLAHKSGLTHLADFAVADCGARLPFRDGGFDAILCIDSISHLHDRRTVLAEWRRLLKPEGRLVFTDPFVVTGRLAKSEIDDRSAVTANLDFVPSGFTRTPSAQPDSVSLRFMTAPTRSRALRLAGARLATDMRRPSNDRKAGTGLRDASTCWPQQRNLLGPGVCHAFSISRNSRLVECYLRRLLTYGRRPSSSRRRGPSHRVRRNGDAGGRAASGRFHGRAHGAPHRE